MPEAREAQKTLAQKCALREQLRSRAKVERKISEVRRLHGLRQGKYSRRESTGLQVQMTATTVNANRLLHLDG